LSQILFHFFADGELDRLPEAVEKAGLFGPNIIALTAWLKGRCHISYRTLKEYFRDVIGMDILTRPQTASTAGETSSKNVRRTEIALRGA